MMGSKEKRKAYLARRAEMLAVLVMKSTQAIVIVML
jgi:hypothetical protein